MSLIGRMLYLKEINCLGDMCPVPIMKLQQCKELKLGERIMLVTDHSCVVESISDFCTKNGLVCKVVEPMNGIWELYIERD